MINQWYDFDNKSGPFKRPANWGATQNVNDDQLHAYGVFEIAEVVPAPDGMVAKTWRYEMIEQSQTLREICATWVDPVEEAAKRRVEKLATITDDIKDKAADMRNILTGYFGEDVVTNPIYTKDHIALLFRAMIENPSTSALDIARISAHAQYLAMEWEVLNAWWGTGETFTFPWEIIS